MIIDVGRVSPVEKASASGVAPELVAVAVGVGVGVAVGVLVGVFVGVGVDVGVAPVVGVGVTEGNPKTITGVPRSVSDPSPSCPLLL
jgi:hypothetical protein